MIIFRYIKLPMIYCCIIDKDGKKLGTFAQYVMNVINLLCSSAQVSPEWVRILNELNELTGLTVEESGEFWSLFKFTPAYVSESIEVSQRRASQRVSDLLGINRLIQEVAASRDRRILASFTDIIRTLGWSDRITAQYDYNLKLVPSV